VKVVRPGRSNWFASRAAVDRGGCVQGGGHLEEDRVFSAIPASEDGLQSFPEGAVRGTDEFSDLVAPREAGEPEGEAPQTVIQLCHRWFSPGFQVVSGPEGPLGEPRFLVDQLLDILPPADHAVGVFFFPPQPRAEEGCCLDTCGLDPSVGDPSVKAVKMLMYNTVFFCLFVCSYSHATLLDHGGVLVNRFSRLPSRPEGRAQWQQPVPSALAFPSNHLTLHRELNHGCQPQRLTTTPGAQPSYNTVLSH